MLPGLLRGGLHAKEGYPPEFRRKVVDLLRTGRSVREVAADLHVSEQTIKRGGVRT